MRKSDFYSWYLLFKSCDKKFDRNSTNLWLISNKQKDQFWFGKTIRLEIMFSTNITILWNSLLTSKQKTWRYYSRFFCLLKKAKLYITAIVDISTIKKCKFKEGFKYWYLFLLGDKCTNAEKELTDTKEVLNALKSDNVSTKKALQGIYFPIFLLSFTLIKLYTVVYRGIKSPNVHHKNTLIWYMIFTKRIEKR